MKKAVKRLLVLFLALTFTLLSVNATAVVTALLAIIFCTVPPVKSKLSPY